MKQSFLTESIVNGDDWRGLELAVIRLLIHAGWVSVQDVGESGDKGADVLAVRNNSNLGKMESYLFQVKAVSGTSYIGVSAINQALQGQAFYKSDIVIVVTNGEFTESAYKRRDTLRSEGFDVRLWNGHFLNDFLNKLPEYAISRRELRPYQSEIVETVSKNFECGIKKSLFIVATGLGKTVIASAAADVLRKKGLKRILVLCHSTDLAQQLQKEFWSQIPKTIPTRVFMGGEPPVPYEGINFGLYQTLFGYLGGVDKDAFDLIIVDEAHHALANAFATCITHLSPRHLIGMTATPWRGDGLSVESIFGEAIAKVSLVDGMKMGYLSQVDYRLMCDNIDWNILPQLSKNSVSLSDLNKRLFIPQRDEAVISTLIKAINEIDNPRIAVFSPSKAHAIEFAKKLNSNNISAENLSIDDKVKRRSLLMKFAKGELTAVTSVDVLNEGIDVPDVNILVFLRATHSRRIFIQQLGRGLRLASGKYKVIVFDFVSDIRRLAAVMEIDKEAKIPLKKGDIERVHLPNGVVTFSDPRTEKFIDAWLEDITNLQDLDDGEKLSFPNSGKFYE